LRDKGRSFAAGLVLQWVVKPLVGLSVAKIVVPLLNLPAAVGTGVVLCSVVSGAQLSNYATFLAAPSHAPLAVLLTSTSTALGSLLTPMLALLLLRARLPPFDPVDVTTSLAQVVALPIAAGVGAQRVFPSRMIAAARPGLSFLALLDTVSCVGASLASNSKLLTGGGAPQPRR
jgi:predicted Na+-dependent transporter